MPKLLLLTDSPGEAELFCDALTVVWERLESPPSSPQPAIDVQHTAECALEILRKQLALGAHSLPDLIVLDLNLPGATSLSCLRELRNDFRLANLPVVVMARSDAQPSMRTLYGLGVVGYLVKPRCFSDLITMVRKICQTWLPKNPRQEICLSDGEQNR